MISAVHSVQIQVAALDAAVAEYTVLLGRPPVQFEAHSKRDRRSAFFALGNTFLELVAGGEGADATELGQSGFCLRCESDDPEAWLAERGIGLSAVSDEQATICDEAFEALPSAARRYLRQTIDAHASRGPQVDLIREESDEIGASGAGHGSAESPVDRRAQIHALDHLVLLSPEADTTCAFYQEGLGLRLALDRTFEKRGVRLLFFRVGGVTIEIGGRLGATPQPDQPDRFGGLAFKVADVEAIAERLLAAGLDVSPRRDGNKPGTRVCTVRDQTQGVPTLLIQPVEPI